MNFSSLLRSSLLLERRSNEWKPMIMNKPHAEERESMESNEVVIESENDDTNDNNNNNNNNKG